METFYRTHSYLVEHTNAPVRRDLMDEMERQTDRHQGYSWRRKNDFPPAICKRKVRNGSLMSVHQHE